MSRKLKILQKVKSELQNAEFQLLRCLEFLHVLCIHWQIWGDLLKINAVRETPASHQILIERQLHLSPLLTQFPLPARTHSRTHARTYTARTYATHTRLQLIFFCQITTQNFPRLLIKLLFFISGDWQTGGATQASIWLQHEVIRTVSRLFHRSG